ncbi:hypothetical protein [Psychrobacter sp. FDAARGOS_221]|uniref:hypothetical protein n=1 Tax=Psychrobacter sp. FDAARGOS_221 TaxID=1975705 RepID=UPI000BB54064|nr:hypothetical protein [Psychrobacter sp. FDAARGOS_221]PNK61064.1 hypothetical protein A6J60_009370 [Psychrobacter sp. FDAARGOS_221]
MTNNSLMLSLLIGLLPLTHIAHAKPYQPALHQPVKLNSLAQQKQYIRQIYAEVNNNLGSYQLTNIDNHGHSTEGGVIKFYTDQNQIRLIEEIYYGETGKYSLQYYFANNDLYFVFEQTVRYNAPISFDTPSLGMEAFDIKKSKIAENRYYFYNGSMIQWLDEDKQSVSPNNSRYINKQNQLLRAVENALRQR